MIEILTHLGAAIAGAVFSYLFLRANAQKKSKIDGFVDKYK